jgi:hypothetical protein
VPQRRISGFQTRFAMETQHHPCPPVLTKQGQVLRLQAAERPLTPPVFCNAMVIIAYGIPKPPHTASWRLALPWVSPGVGWWVAGATGSRKGQLRVLQAVGSPSAPPPPPPPPPHTHTRHRGAPGRGGESVDPICLMNPLSTYLRDLQPACAGSYRAWAVGTHRKSGSILTTSPQPPSPQPQPPWA